MYSELFYELFELSISLGSWKLFSVRPCEKKIVLQLSVSVCARNKREGVIAVDLKY